MSLPIPNIIAACNIMLLEWGEGAVLVRNIVVKNCPDTPRHIANAVKAAGIEGSYWVIRPSGRTLEKIYGELSRKM